MKSFLLFQYVLSCNMEAPSLYISHFFLETLCILETELLFSCLACGHNWMPLTLFGCFQDSCLSFNRSPVYNPHCKSHARLPLPQSPMLVTLFVPPSLWGWFPGSFIFIMIKELLCSMYWSTLPMFLHTITSLCGRSSVRHLVKITLLIVSRHLTWRFWKNREMSQFARE